MDTSHYMKFLSEKVIKKLQWLIFLVFLNDCRFFIDYLEIFIFYSLNLEIEA